MERSRHGSSTEQEDPNAQWWIGRAEDLFGHIRSGQINLRVFGVDGPFMPEPNRAKGLLLTGMRDRAGRDTTQPVDTGGTVFTIGMNEW